MDREYDYNHYSSWSHVDYDNNSPHPPPYHDRGGGHYNHRGGGYNHHRGRYQNHHYEDEQNDSFGYSNGNCFSGRKRPFSHSHSPNVSNEHPDGGGCAKLFVSQVPRDVSEEDIRALFGGYGNITEVVLFKQLRNLQQQDCCFVKFGKSEDADKAVKALDQRYTFPGKMRPIEVRYSRRQEHPGVTGGFTSGLPSHANKVLPSPVNKVFVNFLNRHASKAEIAEVFSSYGYVEDVFLKYDDQKRSRGSGFITFTDIAMATAAINGLSGKYVMEGVDQPLFVQYAEPKRRFGEHRFAPYFSDSHMSSQTGSRAPSVSSTCSDMEDPPECDWSEQICPDGNAYYYNCVTKESLWEKPEEYSYYEQQLENCNQQSNLPWQRTY